MYLTTIRRMDQLYDMDLVDINRDGSTDWTDLMLLGDFLYGTRENPHGIGEPISDLEPDPPPVPTGLFSIDLIYADDTFTNHHKDLVRAAADVWETVVVADVLDVSVDFDTDKDFYGWRQSSTLRNVPRLVYNGAIDDLRIYLGEQKDYYGSYLASAVPLVLRSNGRLPSIGTIAVNHSEAGKLSDEQYRRMILHELGHCLGIGQTWDLREQDNPPYGAWSPHVPGLAGVAAFDRVGGRSYSGPKVPATTDGHWRESVFGDELMTGEWVKTDREPLSEVTIAALKDLGYQVDLSRAEEYSLPPAAKPTTRMKGHAYCKVLLPPPAAK